MKNIHTLLILSAISTIAACAATPGQKAARAAAQKRYEQNLQVALAAQCDKDTALLMKKQFEQAEQPAVLSNKEQQEFRLKYVDKVADPMFQACYKLAWQNHIAQQKLREVRYYRDYYDDWGWHRPFYHPFWW
ncbi:hypothetical protein [Neisseria iguanae]|uniref:Lipoprotein n=1 Tax=Neisseria iguanae TaxID=90242 RepID=A0A2P7U0T1_9NEIS|nr:hypothetical protein [Neisseria iguanae]PSJ80541.1 hypothetical protein C7N83_05555 [Neisseria iguanae]